LPRANNPGGTGARSVAARPPSPRGLLFFGASRRGDHAAAARDFSRNSSPGGVAEAIGATAVTNSRFFGRFLARRDRSRGSSGPRNGPPGAKKGAERMIFGLNSASQTVRMNSEALLGSKAMKPSGGSDNSPAPARLRSPLSPSCTGGATTPVVRNRSATPGETVLPQKPFRGQPCAGMPARASRFLRHADREALGRRRVGGVPRLDRDSDRGDGEVGRHRPGEQPGPWGRSSCRAAPPPRGTLVHRGRSWTVASAGRGPCLCRCRRARAEGHEGEAAPCPGPPAGRHGAGGACRGLPGG
jgi:hypothetical protein